MNIIICDDNIEICYEIKEYVSNNFDFNISICTNESDLKEIIHTHNGDINAIILDIVLNNGVNGIDVAAEIVKNFPAIKIIFLTGYDDIYYKRIFSSFQPYGFIAKPIQYNILNFFLRKLSIEEKHNNIVLNITSNYKEYKIPMGSINYIQSRKRVCEIVTQDEVYTTYLKIADLQNSLTDNFIRCHQSYIVNLDYISTIQKGQIITKNAEYIPVSKKYYQNVREVFYSYLNGNRRGS